MPVTIGDTRRRRDQHHDLVQQVHRAPQLTEHERGLALPQHAQRPQVLVAAPLRHLDDLAGERRRGHAVAVRQRGEEDRHAQVAAAATRPRRTSRSAPASQPPARAVSPRSISRMPSQNAQRTAASVWSSRSRSRWARDPGALAVVVATGEVGRDREPFDVLDVGGSAAASSAHASAQAPPFERRPALRDGAAHAGISGRRACRRRDRPWAGSRVPPRAPACASTARGRPACTGCAASA